MTEEQQAVERALQVVESSDFVPLVAYAEAAEALAAEVRRLRAEVEKLQVEHTEALKLAYGHGRGRVICDD